MEFTLNLIIFFKVNGKMDKKQLDVNVEKVSITKVHFVKIKSKDLASHIGITDLINIQVNGKMGLNTVMEYGKTQMKTSIQVSGLMAKFKAMEFI